MTLCVRWCQQQAIQVSDKDKSEKKNQIKANQEK